jgi:hypothetical protein
MAEKSKKSEGKADVKIPLVAQVWNWFINNLIRACIGILLIGAIWFFVEPSFAKWRRNEAAEAATVAFRQTERDERQYTVTVYPLSAGKPTTIKPGVINFRLTVDQKHLGSGLKLVIQVDGYMSRRYVYDVDSNENLELRAKPGDRSKRVHYPPATYLEVWIDPGSPVQKPATIWIEKLPQ